MSKRFISGCAHAAFFVFILGTGPAARAGNFITAKDDYLWDPATGKPFIPHGIAYQTWNRPLGVWQTHDQIDKDLDDMVRMGANSIRVDFVWQHIEGRGDNLFDWDNYDHLIRACEKRNIKIFALVGYQWPPDWFADDMYTMHPPGPDSEGIYHPERWQSDIINYEHPQARAQYAEFFTHVCGRYKDSEAIAGWIVGNEYGYLGLWSLKYDGYDPWCEQAFRNWCQTRYTNIVALNSAWGSAYTGFSQIVLSDTYEWKGTAGALWSDMVQWHEDSIAAFTAFGAQAAHAADTNHLLAYSTVGMQWGEEDWRYHAEDRGKITRACAAAGAPLGFFAVNNYPWALDGHETRNGQWGVSYTKKVTGVPVVYSETGFTSSETLFPGVDEVRQGILIRNSLWEALSCGGIGTHIFTWQDRPYMTDREKGFGIVTPDRRDKPAMWECRNLHYQLEQVDIGRLLSGSRDPTPDIAFLWVDATDSQYIRFENEMQQEAGALERLGYEPNFIMSLNELAAGAYTNFRVLILPRNMRCDNVVPNSGGKTLNDYLRTVVLPAGVHVIAGADLPGIQDRWGKPRAAAQAELDALFGIDAADLGGFQPDGTMDDSVNYGYWSTIKVRYNDNAPAALRGFEYRPSVWKYNDRIRVTDGTLWAVMDTTNNRGFESSASQVPAWGTWGNVHVRQWFPREGANHLQLWSWSGLWQDFEDVVPGHAYSAWAYLRNNRDDPLTNNTYGVVTLEWYDRNGQKVGEAESPRLTGPNDDWQRFAAVSVAPTNAHTGRVVIKCNCDGPTPTGSLFVDGETCAPAVVAKDHGAGKAIIVLHSLETYPDADGDWNADAVTWTWRSDVLRGLIQDYCGVQPRIQALGTNAALCLPEYRVCADGSYLINVKSYLYNWHLPNGGTTTVFTIKSDMLRGHTIESLTRARIIETNSDGLFDLTLDPDGTEIIHAYSNPPLPLIQIADAPSLIHPTGDQVLQIKVRYDCIGRTNLALKLAFMENGDNGDGITNEIHQLIATKITGGAGLHTFWMWIPDYDADDPDYLSTPEGGRYQFKAWFEDRQGQFVAAAVPQATELKWGIRPTCALPTNVVKGGQYAISFKWEELMEYLPWERTSLTRNDAFPTRVAVFRSSKTEARHPGHFTQVNQVCDWLESLGYESGNNTDIAFDNVTVAGLFADDFNDGNCDGWTRAAGCGNWDPTGGVLRAWRIGNDDNIIVAGQPTWSNYTVSADIRYNRQGPYFNDAEIYLRYQDRNNYYKVGIRNFYGYWRLKYTVKAGGQIVDQNWAYYFSKTNRPVEGTWYNLKIAAQTNLFRVYFDQREVGSFTATNFAAGRIALGTKAVQLGIYDPQRGYYFVDDDELSMDGGPLDLNWGYLHQFFATLMLPGVYVMSDTEVHNLRAWLTNGLYSVIATDGGTAMQDETGAWDLGRVEDLFGAQATIGVISNITGVTIGDANHYITLDYAAGDAVAASGPAHFWRAASNGLALGTMTGGGTSAPALLCRKINENSWRPAKAFCFNFNAAAAGQLQGAFSQLARRVFEWARGEAYKVHMELNYGMIPCATLDGWALGADGTNTLVFRVPEDGLMTGSNLMWTMYVHPWDSENPWANHGGFYSSANDSAARPVTLPGKGLQIIGGADAVFAGRAWGLYAVYNTEGEACTLYYGLQDKGNLLGEDNFNDSNYNGWAVSGGAHIGWSATTRVLRAAVLGAGGEARITREGLNVSNRNLTVEFDCRFTNGANTAGLLYRGVPLYIGPARCGWADTNAAYLANATVWATAGWHRVMVNIRSGAPHWRSDLYVDGLPLFVNERIEVAAFATNTLGFFSPTNAGAVEWDNFRVADEEYSTGQQVVSGLCLAPNAEPNFWAWVPDYDPAWNEYTGYPRGGSNEWYMYLDGQGVNARARVQVYFSPRLMVEHPAFPSNLQPGVSYNVPIEWENLAADAVPSRLRIELVEPYRGVTYATADYWITNATGSGFFPVFVPEMIPAGNDFLWAAYIYTTNATDPYAERVGLDDTFRFDTRGLPIGPETPVRVTRQLVTTSESALYNDQGIRANLALQTWGGPGSAWESDYALGTPPEGNRCFRANVVAGGGWRLANSNGLNLLAFSEGHLVFWVKSAAPLVAGVVAAGRTNEVNLSSYGLTNGSPWKQVVIPVTELGFKPADLTQVTVPFYIRAVGAESATFLVDNVRWVTDTALVYADAGTAPDSAVWVWGSAQLNGSQTGENNPEGAYCFRMSTTTWGGWGVFCTNGYYNLSAFTNGYIALWMKSTDDITIEVKANGVGHSVKASQYGWWGYWQGNSTNWYRVKIPISHFGFSAADLAKVEAAIALTIVSTGSSARATGFIDLVQWVRPFAAAPDFDRYTVHLACQDGVDVFPPATAEQPDYTGAAACHMLARYLNGGTGGVAQTTIYNACAHDPAHHNEITPTAAAGWLNQNVVAGYSFGAMSATNLNEALRTAVYWMDYVPYGGLKTPVPILCGTNWNYKVLRGFQTDRKPYNGWGGNTNSYTIHGLWLTDPTVAGLGYNQFATPAEMATIYRPSVAPATYWMVCEPPEDYALQAAALAEISRTELTMAPPPANPALAAALRALLPAGTAAGARRSANDATLPADLFESVPSALRTDAGFMNLFRQCTATNYYVVNPTNAAATYVLAAGGQRGPGTTLFVLKLNATNAALQLATWQPMPSFFPPVPEAAAVWASRRAIGQPQAACVKAELVYDPAVDASPFFPRWQVVLNAGGTTYVTTVNQQYDLNGDEDGDGMSDRMELYTGTDPSDRASAYHLEAGAAGTPQQPDPARVTLSWPSVAGRRYSLHGAADLKSGFQVIESHIPATPPLNVYTSPLPAAAYFYRVEAE